MTNLFPCHTLMHSLIVLQCCNNSMCMCDVIKSACFCNLPNPSMNFLWNFTDKHLNSEQLDSRQWCSVITSVLCRAPPHSPHPLRQTTANLFPPYSRLDVIIQLLSWDSSCTNKSSEHLVSFITVIIRASTKAAAHSDYATLAHSFLITCAVVRLEGWLDSLLHQEWCNAIMWNMLQQKGQVKAHQNETGKK